MFARAFSIRHPSRALCHARMLFHLYRVNRPSFSAQPSSAPVHARSGRPYQMPLAAAKPLGEIHEVSIERFPTCGRLEAGAPISLSVGRSLAPVDQVHDF
ncbi:hypothetical protein P153DRAFT_168991 [Dothidotthia symphoricarpi CBS 119687]|uniref:Uncharacterized protein n=1 Tax=Dothidotthia symphoricarpi CBS 119687 TaxID=1392245 RepID=A0A6A6AN82_9PLEO|nr:uncharacterized protein P153DRAFT_168991 [Dothidotthia symphoricarpi CBS 119687]KAF2132643.1 hypothetical protein P153DRAFT_168991 [Dothidotthia symphoricarpi CBS 119687]